MLVIEKDERIGEILKNSGIMCENLGPKKGFDVEFELSPLYTASELNNQLSDMNCEAPNLFVFYNKKSGEITIKFEHDAIGIPYNPAYCSNCNISKKCPRYQWHQIDKTFKGPSSKS